MNIIKMLVDPSKYSIKCPYAMVPEFIVVHNTANDASARNEVSYMRSNSNQVSFHYAVDDKEIVQGIPDNRNAWHSGDGGSGKGNRKGLSIEICYSKSGGARFDNAEKLAAKFIAEKLKQYGWGIDKVKKHQDFSNKYCPHRTLDLGWQRFLDMIKRELNANETYPKLVWFDKPHDGYWIYRSDRNGDYYRSAAKDNFMRVNIGKKSYLVGYDGKCLRNREIDDYGVIREVK